MNLQFYWTDKVYLSILALGVMLLIYILKDAQNRHILYQVLRKPLAQAASIILLFFTLISIADSIHLNHQTLFDKWVSPMGQVYEKSYSEPLALRLFYSEIEKYQGKTMQVYPLLVFPQATFKTKAEVNSYVKAKGFNAICIGGAAGILMSILILSLLKLPILKNVSFKTYLPTVVTVILLVGVSVFVYSLSRHLHVLGTGKIGEDILYYALKSIRTGLVIGLVTTLIMMPFAVLLGILAGFIGGVVDDVIQYVYTTLSSVPGVLLITAAVLSFDTYITNHPDMYQSLSELADMRLMVLCLILGLTSWTSLCRLIRGEVLKIRELEFMLAAKALGSSLFYMIRKHILPNVMHLVLMTLVLDFSFLVLAEAVLSYVGVGVSPMTMSWGNMINASRLELAREPIIWWPVLSAFVLMFTLVLASNIMSDALRDGFDPHRDAL